MMLMLDVDAERARVGVEDRGHVTWKERGARDLPGALGEALSVLAGRRPKAVIVAFDGEGRRPTWSGVRAATALGNALAFAWGVPATAVDVPADAGNADIVAAMTAAVADAPPHARVRAVYDGLPNVTTPKGK